MQDKDPRELPMSSLIHHQPQSANGWKMAAPQRDPNVRRQIFGPILPMEQAGFFARFFRRA